MDNAQIAAAGLDLFGGLIGSALNYGAVVNTNNKNAELSREYNDTIYSMNAENNMMNEYLAEMQNEWNLEQWERNNQYNSPEQQKQRLLEAGYNPALMNPTMLSASSPQSAELANQQSNAQGMQQPIRMEAPQLSTYLGVSDQVGKAFTNAKLEAETAKAHAEEKEAIARERYYDTQSNLGNAELPWLDEFYELRNKLQKSQINSNGAAAQVYNETANRIRTLTNYEMKQFIANIHKIEADTEYTKALKQTEDKLRNAKVKVLNSQANSNNASARYSNALAKTEDDLRDVRHDILSEDRIGKHSENVVRKATELDRSAQVAALADYQKVLYALGKNELQIKQATAELAADIGIAKDVVNAASDLLPLLPKR